MPDTPLRSCVPRCSACWPSTRDRRQCRGAARRRITLAQPRPSARIDLRRSARRAWAGAAARLVRHHLRLGRDGQRDHGAGSQGKGWRKWWSPRIAIGATATSAARAGDDVLRTHERHRSACARMRPRARSGEECEPEPRQRMYAFSLHCEKDKMNKLFRLIQASASRFCGTVDDVRRISDVLAATSTPRRSILPPTERKLYHSISGCCPASPGRR